MVTTEEGRMALCNASIWANEIDLVAVGSGESVNENEGFVSDFGDVWASTTSVSSVNVQ
jgi:hypothetical protein